jgi:gluconolactonase
MSSPFSRVSGPFSFTEGPVWDGERVIFTDMPTSRILAYDPERDRTDVKHVDTRVANGLALDAEGRLLACQEAGRRVVRYELDGDTTVIAEAYDGHRLNSPNDVIVARDGTIWFTDPRYGNERADMELAHESVYQVQREPQGYAVTRRTFDTSRPNGLALSPDESVLYVAESPRAPDGIRQLRAYPVEQSGVLGDPTVLLHFGSHRGVDGMCVLDDGTLVITCGWARSGPGPRVMVLAPGGEVLEQIPTPGDPTNVCLGGPERSDLYLTSFDGGLWRLKGFA